VVTEGRMSVGRVVIEGETTIGGGVVIDNAVVCCSAGGKAVGEELTFLPPLQILENVPTVLCGMVRTYTLCLFFFPSSSLQVGSKCEGCNKVSPTVKGFTEFQCVGEKPHKLCDDCRNQSRCPIHPWAKRR